MPEPTPERTPERTTRVGSALFELTRLRLLTFLRQPEAVFWVFVFPVLLALILGLAFRGGGPSASRVALVRGELGLEPAQEQELEQRLGLDELLQVEWFDLRSEAERALASGKLDALLTALEPPSLRLDPTRAEAELARLRVTLALQDGDRERLLVEPVEERGARYVDFLFPGLLGMNLMGTGMWAIGFAVAELRQRKVLKRLLVTPMRRSTFLLSFLTSRVLFLAMEVLVLVLFGTLALGVPLRGQPLTFAALCLLGALGFAGLGLLAASRARTIEGVSGLLNLFMLPMWLGSGVFFSYERFPAAVQPLLRLLPLTALNDALRACMLEGAGLLQLGPELAVLGVWTVLPFAIALRLFRWQ